MAIVKYHNDLNKVVLTKLDAKETDIFYTIIYKMKEKTEAVFSPSEIKKWIVSNDKNRSEERFFNSLNNVFKTQLRVYKNHLITDYHLFITKEFNSITGDVTIEIHPKCHHILNNLLEKYTKFELEEFISLKSEYSKKLFRLLMQFKDTGKRTFDIYEFQVLLEIPMDYKMCNIDQKVLQPCIKELSDFFTKLKYTKLKKGKNKRDVSHIEFTWKKDDKQLSGKEVIENKKQLEIQEAFYLDSQIIVELFNLCKTQTSEIKNFITENIEKYSYEILESNIKYVNKYSKDNYLAYFKKALLNDWGKSIREKEEKMKNKPKNKNVYVSEIENPKIETIEDYAKSLGVKVEELTEQQKRIFKKIENILKVDPKKQN